jgi:3-hydroxyisobutyrate dehydrogenase-like beta-hydroxyacid dehydrogenase
MSRITFLGLGSMGRRMAARLVDAGHQVTVWNRTPGPAADLQALGAQVAASPREAASPAEFVMAMVYNDEASRRVWLDPQHGAAVAMLPTAIAIESSTLTPGWVHELGGTLAERGVRLIDAPVAGSRPQAEAGQLIYMVGGDAQAVETSTPVLSAMGAAVHAVGGPGSGAWLKLAVNALLGAQAVAMAEQLAMLQRAGIDPLVALAALRTMPVTSASAAGAAALMLGGNFAPQAPVALIAKDLDYALRAAQRLGLDMTLTGTVAQRFRDAEQRGLGTENFVAVAKLYR